MRLHRISLGQAGSVSVGPSVAAPASVNLMPYVIWGGLAAGAIFLPGYWKLAPIAVAGYLLMHFEALG